MRIISPFSFSVRKDGRPMVTDVPTPQQAVGHSTYQALCNSYSPWYPNNNREQEQSHSTPSFTFWQRLSELHTVWIAKFFLWFCIGFLWFRALVSFGFLWSSFWFTYIILSRRFICQCLVRLSDHYRLLFRLSTAFVLQQAIRCGVSVIRRQNAATALPYRDATSTSLNGTPF